MRPKGSIPLKRCASELVHAGSGLSPVRVHKLPDGLGCVPIGGLTWSPATSWSRRSSNRGSRSLTSISPCPRSWTRLATECWWRPDVGSGRIADRSLTVENAAGQRARYLGKTRDLEEGSDRT